MDVKTSVVGHLAIASKEIQAAYKDGTDYHPMAAEIPVFQKLQGLIKELNAIMLEVNKLRGLG
jgi:hypothetical protein